MRILTTISLITIIVCSHGQTIPNKDNRFLTFEQNESWLASTKSLDTPGLWNAIKLRFFSKETSNTPDDSIRYSPLMVINGIPFDPPRIETDQDSEKLLKILNQDSIEQIEIITEMTGDWIFHMPFSGVVILRLPKKVENKLYKLKLK
ncbi:hypothetical protein [Fulvivirga sp.]|uniref:hypothetical protein n=1 Tax=Fulvivirga sp. TaxID=1931237 RepID=UPI0032EBC5DA